MQLEAPTSIEAVALDGTIARSAVDEALRVVCHSPQGVDYLPREGGYLAELSSPAGRWQLRGTTVATVEGGEWTWAQKSPFPIEELQGSQPLSPQLVDAARSLHGNGPLWYVPTATGAHAVVFDIPFALPEPRHALALGLAALELGGASSQEAERAVLVYAAWAGLPARREAGALVLGSGDAVMEEKLLPLDGVPALHGELLSREHDLFFEARYPATGGGVSWENGILTLDGQQVPGVAVAEADGNTWRWSYFSDSLAQLPWAAPARQVKRYGIDAALPLLLAPEVPLKHAERLCAQARAILGLSFRVWVGRQLVLFQLPSLPLPPLRDDVTRAVLGHAPWPEAEVAAYARARGAALATSADGVFLGGVRLRREGERLRVED